MNQLKIVFAGTPAIAKTALAKIIEHGFQVPLVLTQPDRPAGRGLKLMPSPVKQLALEYGLLLAQPTSFKQQPEVIKQIQQLQPDIMVVVAYGLIIPPQLLAIPRLGCINLHVSLLPRWRGAAPIQRAILAGDQTSGVTVMQMDAGLDTGAKLLVSEVPIAADDTAGSLHDKLANQGALDLIRFLQKPDAYPPQPQAEIGVSYAHKLNKEEARINWHEPAELIARKIRGYNPAPGAFCYLDGVLHKIWAARPITAKIIPPAVGTIVATDEQLLVACGNHSWLAISELQEAGNKRKSAKLYASSKTDLIGKQFRSSENE